MTTTGWALVAILLIGPPLLLSWQTRAVESPSTASVAPGGGGPLAPQIATDTPYDAARAQIIAGGWTPYEQTSETSPLTQRRRKTWPELIDCAGTGIGPCAFLFRDPDSGRLLRVYTEREDPLFQSAVIEQAETPALAADEAAAPAAVVAPVNPTATAESAPSGAAQGPPSVTGAASAASSAAQDAAAAADTAAAPDAAVAESPAVPSATAAAPPILAVGAFRDRMRSGGDGPIMVRIGGGRFRQGSPADEPLREADEGPIRTVSVSAFAIGQYEVTRGQFRSFVAATGYRTDAERNAPVGGAPAEGCFAESGSPRRGWRSGANWRDPGYAQTDAHPVVCVSWNDAQAYVQWLSRETGQRYRLPSERELEYVIRAGTTTPWPWGTEIDAGCTAANHADASLNAPMNSAVRKSSCSDGQVYTAPAGRFAANRFGLHDTAGNAWEWAQDCWNDGYAETQSSYSGASESGDCTRRVVRGGAWSSGPASLRPAHRNWNLAAGRYSSNGFRVVREL